jgi:hypothetical protein
MPRTAFHRERQVIGIYQDKFAATAADSFITARDQDDSSSEVDEDSDDGKGMLDSSVRIGMEAEEFDLLLPSSAAAIQHNLASHSLQEKEKRLRRAQLEAYLQDLRRLLRIKSSAYLDKRKNVSGQKAGTRSNSQIDRFNSKIDLTADGYQAARAALLRLDPSGSWQERLKSLTKSDIRAPEQDESDMELDDQKSAQRLANRIRRRVRRESKRQISWIWKVPREAVDGVMADSENDIGSGA